MVGGIVALVLLVGVVSSVQQLVSDDPMMGTGGSVPAIHFVAPSLLSLLVAAVVAASYSISRTAAFQPSESEDAKSVAAETGAEDVHDSTPNEVSSDADAQTAVTHGERPVLDLLPEDERRVLEPVIEREETTIRVQ